jgi:hypothetical protein
VARMGRPGLSDAQKAELWHRWKEGQSLTEIGLALSKHAGSIHSVVSARGGIPPAARRRSSTTLTLAEREEISRGLAAQYSVRCIASTIGRSPSTVSRETSRHGGSHRYRASQADESAWDRARRPKACLLSQRPRLRDIVAAKLALQRSPEQVSGWLERAYPNDQTMQVSHETIYRSLFIQARGVLKKELVAHLRSRRMMRRSQARNDKGPAARSDHRRALASRASGRYRRTGDSRTLGRRLTLGRSKLSQRHLGRATFAVYASGQSGRKRHHQRRRGAKQTGPQTAQQPTSIPDVGSGLRAGKPTRILPLPPT